MVPAGSDQAGDPGQIRTPVIEVLDATPDPSLQLALLDRLGKGHVRLARNTLGDDSCDPFLVSAAIRLLVRAATEDELILLMADENSPVRCGAALAYRQRFPRGPREM